MTDVKTAIENLKAIRASMKPGDEVKLSNEQFSVLIAGVTALYERGIGDTDAMRRLVDEVRERNGYFPFPDKPGRLRQ